MHRDDDGAGVLVAGQLEAVVEPGDVGLVALEVFRGGFEVGRLEAVVGADDVDGDEQDAILPIPRFSTYLAYAGIRWPWLSTRHGRLSEDLFGGGEEDFANLVEAFARIVASGALAMAVGPFVVARRVDQGLLETLEAAEDVLEVLVGAGLGCAT